jgi:hypothetical protein
VWSYNVYRTEQDAVREGAESDYLLVDCYRPPLGQALSMGSVEELFVQLWAKVGFRACPHMLRHSFASEVALATRWGFGDDSTDGMVDAGTGSTLDRGGRRGPMVSRRKLH